MLELDKFNPALKVFKNIEKNYKADAKSVPEIYWINVLYCIATCEEFLNNYPVALRYYKQLFKSYEKFYQQAPLNESYLYRSMGRCYRELKNYDMAYEYFQLGMNCAPNEYSKAMIFGALGMTYQKQKKFSKAIKCYDKSLELFFRNKAAFAKYIAQISLAKAKVLIIIGQKDEAITCLKNALNVHCSGMSVKKINKLILKIKN